MAAPIPWEAPVTKAVRFFDAMMDNKRYRFCFKLQDTRYKLQVTRKTSLLKLATWNLKLLLLVT
jgi:hypothetical protein